MKTFFIYVYIRIVKLANLILRNQACQFLLFDSSLHTKRKKNKAEFKLLFDVNFKVWNLLLWRKIWTCFWLSWSWNTIKNCYIQWKIKIEETKKKVRLVLSTVGRNNSTKSRIETKEIFSKFNNKRHSWQDTILVCRSTKVWLFFRSVVLFSQLFAIDSCAWSIFK